MFCLYKNFTLIARSVLAAYRSFSLITRSILSVYWNFSLAQSHAGRPVNKLLSVFTVLESLQWLLIIRSKILWHVGTAMYIKWQIIQGPAYWQQRNRDSCGGTELKSHTEWMTVGATLIYFRGVNLRGDTWNYVHCWIWTTAYKSACVVCSTACITQEDVWRMKQHQA